MNCRLRVDDETLGSAVLTNSSKWTQRILGYHDVTEWWKGKTAKAVARVLDGAWSWAGAKVVGFRGSRWRTGRDLRGEAMRQLGERINRVEVAAQVVTASEHNTLSKARGYDAFHSTKPRAPGPFHHHYYAKVITGAAQPSTCHVQPSQMTSIISQCLHQ